MQMGNVSVAEATKPEPAKVDHLTVSPVINTQICRTMAAKTPYSSGSRGVDPPLPLRPTVAIYI
jgi:hypothetical protein